MNAADKSRGFLLPCPHCGEAEARVKLFLDDLTFECGECEATFGGDDVRNLLRKWTQVMAWIDSAPVVE